MIIYHPKVPDFREDWLRDEHEVIDIFLAKIVRKYRRANVDDRQIVLLCCSNKSGTRGGFVWSFLSSGWLQLKSHVKIIWSVFSHNPSISKQ